ncbi:MAG: hypothetical protein LBK70_01895 [Clostridiales bacterium]|jgi:hypothetical protein|nr:hypothetical protein [Clostridiales bacterium]
MSNFNNQSGFNQSNNMPNAQSFDAYSQGQGYGAPINPNLPMDPRMMGNAPNFGPNNMGYNGFGNTNGGAMHPGLPNGIPNNGARPGNVGRGVPMPPMGGGFGGQGMFGPQGFGNGQPRHMYPDEPKIGSSLYMILVGIMAILGLVGAFVAGYFIGVNANKKANNNNGATTTPGFASEMHIETIATSTRSLQDCLLDLNIKL